MGNTGSQQIPMSIVWPTVYNESKLLNLRRHQKSSKLSSPMTTNPLLIIASSYEVDITARQSSLTVKLVHYSINVNKGRSLYSKKQKTNHYS